MAKCACLACVETDRLSEYLRQRLRAGANADALAEAFNRIAAEINATRLEGDAVR